MVGKRSLWVILEASPELEGFGLVWFYGCGGGGCYVEWLGLGSILGDCMFESESIDILRVSLTLLTFALRLCSCGRKVMSRFVGIS